MSGTISTVHCIGAGSIGSFSALLLACLGRTFPMRLVVHDFDEVASHNVMNQLYRSGDVGTAKDPVFKVDALADILREFSQCEVVRCREKVGPGYDFFGPVVVMVDSLAERANIFSSVRYHAGVPLLVDGRAGGAIATVFALDPRDGDQVRAYEQTLKGAAAPAPCANANTIPTLWAIASAVGWFVQRFSDRRIPKFTELLINYSGVPIMAEEDETQ